MTRRIDPARLVQDDGRRPSLDETPELAAVTDVREDVQEVAGLGGTDARATPAERSEPPLASQTERWRRARSAAVVALPIPQAGWSTTVTGTPLAASPRGGSSGESSEVPRM